MSVPPKYQAMHDFHEYYSGARNAPYLTIFVGGNHEASNYMWELYYGGWAAPNIYYMGAANVVRLGPLRIAGISGIWKAYNYRKPHYERLPYNSDDVKSAYHVRELDVRKLLQIRTQVDVGLSHDWPRGVEWHGNHKQLFKWKPDFEQEAKDGTLGSVAAKLVLEHLRPPHWFSAHLHVKYSAIMSHENTTNKSSLQKNGTPPVQIQADNEIELDLNEDGAEPPAAPKNEAEIDLDIDDDGDNSTEAATTLSTDRADLKKRSGTDEVPQDVRDLLPEAFAKPQAEPKPATLPFPEGIPNRTTKFLSLDKCEPKRSFLQLLEISPHAPSDFQRPLQLEYDKEWLAITRVFAQDLRVGDPHAQIPADRGDAVYRPLIEQELPWIEEHVVKPGKMTIPTEFTQTAPIYDPALGIRVSEAPQEYSNPHTQAFCDLLQIPNVFHATDEERAQLMQIGPRPEQQHSNRGGGRGGFRGGNRGRGGGRGRGRGQARSRGRW